MVAGQDVPQDGMVRGPLDVGLAAQGVDAAAATPMLPSRSWSMQPRRMFWQPDGVLGPAQGVHDGAGLSGLPVAAKASYTLSRLSLTRPVTEETVSRLYRS
jgi:hypothetical protein